MTASVRRWPPWATSTATELPTCSSARTVTMTAQRRRRGVPRHDERRGQRPLAAALRGSATSRGGRVRRGRPHRLFVAHLGGIDSDGNADFAVGAPGDAGGTGGWGVDAGGRAVLIVAEAATARRTPRRRSASCGGTWLRAARGTT